MNHDLPTPFTQIQTLLLVAHDGKTPLFKVMHSGVYVACHVKQQIFTHHAHQVDTCIAHMIFGIVLAKACAHVTVDRIQALGYRTGTHDVCLFGDDDLLVLPPISCLECRTRTTQARTDNQDVDIVFNNCRVAHQYCTPFLISRPLDCRVCNPPSSIRIYLGSLNSSWLSRISLLGAGTFARSGVAEPQGLVVIGASSSMSFLPLRNLMRHAIVPFSSSRITRTLCPSGAKSA